METEQHQNELVSTISAQGSIALPSAGTENLPILPPASEPDTQWRRISRQISRFLEQLPEYIGSFFQQYRQPLITIGLLFSAVVAAKIVLALLSAIHDIPLLAPAFELIGIGYAIWFISRYLLKSSTRQELATEIQVLKQEIVGG
ncbi:CAAD domain-containing protein [Calothrix sp. PCC 7507]|uniref:CAAD domain-containing protein n=1 Tax=Calothrix sp. PCC 7507 TaxID=99598 RepID=UPI00029F2896|nr:CAAD domain-containing protein [Calothrix sp. PCC 7507]AFY34683.1 hypothetical protein Cal7507_4308 [Calothrix sp. PCC 7507]